MVFVALVGFSLKQKIITYVVPTYCFARRFNLKLYFYFSPKIGTFVTNYGRIFKIQIVLHYAR